MAVIRYSVLRVFMEVHAPKSLLKFRQEEWWRIGAHVEDYAQSAKLSKAQMKCATFHTFWKSVMTERLAE
jgi:hypothetical protein